MEETGSLASDLGCERARVKPRIGGSFRFQAAETLCSTSRGVPDVIASIFSGDIFSFLAATFTLSFSKLLSASFVIHFAPTTPIRKAPAKAGICK